MILEYDISCLLVLLTLLQVLKTILDLLPIAPDVQQVTLDFEMAMWAALRIILPDVQIKGCVFHWSQAIWRKVSYKVEKTHSPFHCPRSPQGTYRFYSVKD